MPGVSESHRQRHDRLPAPESSGLVSAGERHELVAEFCDDGFPEHA